MSSRVEFFANLWSKIMGRIEHQNSVTGPSPPPPPPPPWDPWDFDYKFFKDLNRWNDKNPESTIERIFEKVNKGLQHVEPLLELIPDSPFPARGLVKALAHLVTLGANLARARSEVQGFAMQIVEWVTEMSNALKDGRATWGSFSWKAKKNLEKRSGLIHQICAWAAARLNDNRWDQITKGLSISGEIAEFKVLIAEARALFMDLSMVNLSQGIDKLLEGQKKISLEIKRVRELQQNQLGMIIETLEAQAQAEERQQFMERMLQSRIVANPTYDEQGKQPCDPDTRVDILADIHTWIQDLSFDSKSFLWLTGDPGAGKSAITASVAKECKDAGILWAQFFINRNNVDTTNPKSYFPSIARQLADHHPGSEVALAIHDALKNKQSLVDDISAEQAMGLFVNAIEVAAQMDPEKPVVVVIDGLDESERSRLVNTAKIFSSLFKTLRCPNAKVFISSRTDDEIRRSFAQAGHADHVKHVHLDTAEESSVRDVSTFLARRIGDIVEEHDLNWEIWPGEERLQALCIRASGLFIWAVTAVKFFQEQINVSGTEVLNELLDALSSAGLGDINVLYGTILDISYRKADEWAMETFRHIVGCVIVLQEPLSVGAIRELLDLRNKRNGTPVDFINFFRLLRTVLVAGADAISNDTVPRLHKSFFEFITSDRADGRFRVRTELSNGEIATKCLRNLSTFDQSYRESTHPNPAPVPTAVLYALRFWRSHMSQEEIKASGVAIVSGSPLLAELQEQLQKCLEYRSSEKPLGIAFLPNRSSVLTSWDDTVHAWDGSSGQPIELPAFEGHADTVTSVAFSPDGSYVVSGSDDETVRLWDAGKGRAIGSALRGHTGTVYSVAFSPDGTSAVSGSRDGTIRFWEVPSGKPIGLPFKGHAGEVNCVAFSPDGSHVVSGSDDQTIQLWEVQTGKPVGSAFKGHTRIVLSVAFSPDGARIVSGSEDKTVRVWDVQSGKPHGTPFTDHTAAVFSVGFSPDGSRIVSGSRDNTVRLWDVDSGKAVGSLLEGHTNTVRSVAFSPDGTRIVSGSWDKTIRVWDVRSGKDVGLPFGGPNAEVYSVAFSPDGTRIVSGSADHIVRMWDARTGKPAPQPKLRVPAGHVSAIATFSASQRTVVASSDGTVQVWDSKMLEPLGAPLIGDLAIISSVTVSPDEKLIAAVDTNGRVCLWDTETSEPLSHTEIPLGGPTSLSFSANCTRVVLSRLDGTVFRWDIGDQKPLLTSTPPSSNLLLQSAKALSFDMKDGWQRGAAQRDVAPSLYWVPFDDPDTGLWAYVDGKLIRGDGGDSVTMYDIGGESESQVRVA